MTETKKSDPSFNILLTDFLDSHLREDFSLVISKKLGEVIEKISKEKLICHIQWTGFDGKKLHNPIVWRYKYWVDSSEKWQKDKDRSDRERTERHIFNANVKRVSKRCMEFMLMDEQHASSTAFCIVKHNKKNAMEMLGITLIEKESEL